MTTMLTPDLATDAARIERALHWLDAHVDGQPSLDEAALEVGLSPFHFQRLFTKWVGISPKRYLQAATAERARELLRASRPVLETAFSVGLSGPGRLHDLVVHTDGVTPGELSRGGDGVVIQYGFHDTPFGEALVAITTRGVCGLTFDPDGERQGRLERLRHDWPAAELREDVASTASVAARIGALGEVGSDARPVAPLALVLKGTNLQVRVWQALLRMPVGTLASYEDLAAAVGAPRAIRAVANAVGRNPIHFLIPCHRVVRKSGALGGYAGGLQRKRAMLALELAGD